MSGSQLEPDRRAWSSTTSSTGRFTSAHPPMSATYLLVRIDDRERPDGSCCDDSMPLVEAARPSRRAARDTSVTVAFTYQGLQALGVTPASLDSFAPEFRQGMAARAADLGDMGDSSPAAWERPLGSPDVHVAMAVLSPDAARLQASLDRARRTYQELRGVEVIWRQDCYQLPSGRTSFGFKDGIGQPAIEGSGMPGTQPHGVAHQGGRVHPRLPGRDRRLPAHAVAGNTRPERDLHRVSEAPHPGGRLPPIPAGPVPRAGTKRAAGGQDGGPLAERRSAGALPRRDDPELGSDPKRNNRFLYGTTRAVSCVLPGPMLGAPTLETRWSVTGASMSDLHRMIRRGTSYGPPLPEGVLEDDGVDRGIVFVFAGTHLDRQFEFVKTQWLNDGVFIGAPEERDPLVGSADGSGPFTIPQRPIRRRLQGLPPFVVTRGGEYCFAPGLRALDWLAGLDT